MDQVAAPFAQNLAAMKKEGECFVSFIIGSLIYDSRNSFCAQAIKTESDYVLWLDSDMVFPLDIMPRLIKHMEEGADIVTGLYFRRRPPFTPVLFSRLDYDEETKTGHHDGYDDYPKETTFEIEGCGFGCVMTRRAVIEDIMLNYLSCFAPMGGLGEDLSFCIRARQLGYKILCDSTIKCGHVGQLIVDEGVFESTRGIK